LNNFTMQEYPELMNSNGRSSLRVNTTLDLKISYSRLLMLALLMDTNILEMEVDLSLHL
jgi:hypothetical protein